MPFEQVGDIVERIRVFHQQLRATYKEAAERQPDHRLSFVLDYMARHERYFDGCLAKFAREGRDALNETWIQNVPDREVERAIEQASLDPDMSADELIHAALTVDEALVELYRTLATTLTAPRVRELFEDLLEQVEVKDKNVARRINELRQE